MPDASTLRAFNQRGILDQVEAEAKRALKDAVAEAETWGELGDPHDPWSGGGDEEDDMDEDGISGLGSFFKKIHNAIKKVALAPIKWVSPKLAHNLDHLDNRVQETGEKIKDSVVKWVRKNFKWVAIVVAIAITIYSMGAGAGIAAHLLSGIHAMGSSISAAIASVHGSTWVSLATTGAKMLASGKKVSDLSADQAQAMIIAQQNGVDLVHPDLAPYLQQRAQLGGGPIPTDEYGRPLVGPDGKPLEQSVVDGMPMDARQAYAQGAANAQAALGPAYGTGAPPPGSYTAPLAIGGGLLALKLLL